ncbi:hypothetical protein ACFWBX_01275 [Streptomyces sp. NPDC059991]|uniref:hypothetical protein n=1 Tax=Streptomyces sp. NPDC059991 TaxID=3347028 RepID=UPI0036D07B4D
MLELLCPHLTTVVVEHVLVESGEHEGRGGFRGSGVRDAVDALRGRTAATGAGSRKRRADYDWCRPEAGEGLGVFLRSL